MIVPGHGGVVEERGFVRVARVGDEDVFCEAVFEGGAGGHLVQAG